MIPSNNNIGIIKNNTTDRGSSRPHRSMDFRARRTEAVKEEQKERIHRSSTPASKAKPSTTSAASNESESTRGRAWALERARSEGGGPPGDTH